MLALLCSFIIPFTASHARPNNVIMEFDTLFLGIGGFDEISTDIYGVNHYVNMITYSTIATEDCPLQGDFTRIITSYVKPFEYGLGIWHNSFVGTYNGEEASFEGWTATYEWAGYGYYLGKGALGGYIIKYTIDGSKTELMETVELVRRNRKKTFDFEFVYDEVGDPASITVDGSGVWWLENTPHYGHVTSPDNNFFAGDIFVGSDLVLLDDLMAPTTFNGFGTGLMEFDGIYQRKSASFSGTIYFLIDDFAIMGLFLAEGEGKFDDCLITGFFTSSIGGATYVEMSSFRIY